MKIILAVDGSANSDAAAKEVARRPWPPDSELKIISVANPALRTTPETWALSVQHYQDADQETREEARAALERADSFFPTGADATLKVATETLAGPPAEVILDTAHTWGADLIVVGSRGLGSLERFLLGSVSKEVALHANCSVEIVRERKGEEKNS